MMALGDVLVTELIVKNTRRWDGRHGHYHQQRCLTTSRQDIPLKDTTKEKIRKKENGIEPKNKSRRKKSTDITSDKNKNKDSSTASEPADDSNPESGPSSVEFIYEIRADSDHRWLVSGQRRSRFTMKAGFGGEDEVHRFPVFLVPLVTGELLFPNVDIKVFEEPKYLDPNRITGDDGDDGKDNAGTDPDNIDDRSSKKPAIICETNYLNESETILVVPNIRSCTVGVGFSEVAEPGDDESVIRPARREKGGQAKTNKEKDEEGGGEEEEEEEEEAAAAAAAAAERDRLRTERLVETKLLEVEYRTAGFA